jgi:hypothetical protein
MKKATLAACAMAGFVLSAPSADAAVFTIGDCFTGDCGNLTGSVSITITDDLLDENPGSGDVKVVIANNTNGFIDQLGVLYSGGLPADSTIAGFTGTGGTGEPVLQLGTCNTDNSGQSLNVCFDFPQPNATRFDAGDTVTFFLDSITTAILESVFDQDSSFAHVNEVAGGRGSAKITFQDLTDLPEPGTLLLFATGALGAALARRRQLRHR